jgi:thioredoxin 1
MELEHLNEEELRTAIASEDIIVDFYAHWCGPCKVMVPVLESLAKKLQNIKVVKVDVENCQSICKELKIMSVPTLIRFSEGQEVGRLIGFHAEEDIINKLHVV